ncbi:MAG: glycosyltransferase, partial [Candidatus Bathyarchaeia archaeon]
MKDTEPLVSVIVPTKNSESTIEKCLTSIVGQSYSSIEVIVVDNFSKDDTVKIAQKFGAKVFLKGPERSAQVNFGVAKASGKYVYRVDSDFVLQPNVVKEAVEACEKHGFDAVAIHNTSDPRISFWAKVRKLERDCYKKDKLNSAARFWRKEVFVSIGGFDVKLMAGEDYDLQNSLTKRGYKVGWIEAEEVHIGEPKTLWEIIQKHYYYGKNLAFFIKKN